MSIEIRGLSFNIAGSGDMRHQLAKKYPGTSFRDDEVENRYKTLTAQTFEKIVREFTPAFMCLQEITRAEHSFLIEFLQNKGYTIVQKYGTAVCFQEAQFTCLGSEMTLNNDEGALYADLQLKGTKKILRVVSSHLPGFNVSKFEQSPQTAELGDRALQQQLATVNATKKVFDRLFACFKETYTPDLILYGLDANSTAAFLSEKVHPERLAPLFTHGFTPDTSDTKATIIDDSTNHPYRYDYLFCKCVKGSATIQNCEIAGINDPSMLGNPDSAMSDHLPVLSRIFV